MESKRKGERDVERKPLINCLYGSKALVSSFLLFPLEIEISAFPVDFNCWNWIKVAKPGKHSFNWLLLVMWYSIEVN